MMDLPVACLMLRRSVISYYSENISSFWKTTDSLARDELTLPTVFITFRSKHQRVKVLLHCRSKSVGGKQPHRIMKTFMQVRRNNGNICSLSTHGHGLHNLSDKAHRFRFVCCTEDFFLVFDCEQPNQMLHSHPPRVRFLTVFQTQLNPNRWICF